MAVDEGCIPYEGRKNESCNLIYEPLLDSIVTWGFAKSTTLSKTKGIKIA